MTSPWISAIEDIDGVTIWWRREAKTIWAEMRRIYQVRCKRYLFIKGQSRIVVWTSLQHNQKTLSEVIDIPANRWFQQSFTGTTGKLEPGKLRWTCIPMKGGAEEEQSLIACCSIIWAMLKIGSADSILEADGGEWNSLTQLSCSLNAKSWLEHHFTQTKSFFCSPNMNS